MAELPLEFLDSMKQLLGQEYEEYLACFSEDCCRGIRVNTNKISTEHFRRICPFPIEPVPWIENGFYYDTSVNPAKHPYYAAGLYYIQEPSAMTPASLLPVKEGDFVCDLCAAPGGKATELGAKLGGTGFLLANDISHSRAKGLLKNIELFGLQNAYVSSESPEKLLAQFGSVFDKILVDAPCSGEGMFRKDAELIKSYREHGPSYYSPMQKQIILSAADLLKPGGFMVYSTCTFSEEEDEEVIAYLLKERPGFSVCDIRNEGRYYEGFYEGRQGLSDCIRIYPHRMKGEGHFMALLHKSDSAEDTSKTNVSEKTARRFFNESMEEFFSLVKTEFPKERIFLKNEEVYSVHPKVQVPQGIRFLRTGLHLGSVKKGRFEPSQTLAMTLKAEEFSNVWNLSSKDERVFRYLKGETIDLSDVDIRKGWCLVTVDGFSLGFGKVCGSLLKNKYRAGWRWM